MQVGQAPRPAITGRGLASLPHPGKGARPWTAGLPPSNDATNARRVFPSVKLAFTHGKGSGPSEGIHSNLLCPALFSEFMPLFLEVCGSAQP